MTGSAPVTPAPTLFDDWQVQAPAVVVANTSAAGNARGAIVGFSFSLETGSVAVRNACGQVFERTLEGHRSHAVDALPTVQQLMQQAGVGPSDVVAVAADAGPGGFTGLRTACGLAQGLAVGWQVPCVAVSSLSLMTWSALQGHDGDAVCMAVLDARQQEVYAAVWVKQAGRISARLAPSLLPYGSEPLAVLHELAGSGALPNHVLLVGPGVAHLPATEGPQLHTNLLQLPHAAALVQLAAQAVATHATIAPSACQPLYVRNQVALTTAQRQQAGRG